MRIDGCRSGRPTTSRRPRLDGLEGRYLLSGGATFPKVPPPVFAGHPARLVVSSMEAKSEDSLAEEDQPATRLRIASTKSDGASIAQASRSEGLAHNVAASATDVDTPVSPPHASSQSVISAARGEDGPGEDEPIST